MGQYDAYLLKRHGVTRKQLDAWYAEYEKDREEGLVWLCSHSILAEIHKYLCNTDLQRKYRRCKKYKIIDNRHFEGVVRKTNQKIRLEFCTPPIKKYIKFIKFYIDDELMIESKNKFEVLDWVKENIK